jgi:hypothetical protein
MLVIAVAIALPLLVALAAIRASDIDLARSCGASYPNAHFACDQLGQHVLRISKALLKLNPQD